MSKSAGLVGNLSFSRFFVVLVFTGLMTAPTIASVDEFIPNERALAAEQGGILDKSSVRTLRRVEEAGIVWSVVGYQTSKWRCLDLWGREVGAFPGTPSASLGGCGFDASRDFHHLNGFLLVGKQTFNVGLGIAPPGSLVEVTRIGGSTLVDRVGPEGVWLVFGSQDLPFSRIVAKSGAGEVIGDVMLGGVTGH